jgi:DNA-binding response OmpR family regulator
MSQKKILIVDDDPEMRLAMHVRLKANHYDVGFAVDGVSGISEARRQQPDVILLDLGLPAGDGFTVLERLQSNNAMASIPVIVISGRDRAANRDRSLKAGAKVFLQKPVRNSDLLLAIEQVLGVKTAPAAVVYEVDGAPHEIAPQLQASSWPTH